MTYDEWLDGVIEAVGAWIDAGGMQAMSPPCGRLLRAIQTAYEQEFEGRRNTLASV